MKSSGRFRLFRPASWSFATRATVVPSLGLVLMAVVIALLVNRTVRNLQLESLQTDFELLGQAQARRVTQIVVRQVSLLNALAQSSVIAEHAQEHQEAPAGELPANHAEASARVRKQIDLFLRRFPQFTSVVITDAEGKLIASSADTGRTDYSGEEWHTFTVSGVAGRLYLSDRKAVMPEAEAGEGIEIALPVLNEIDQPIGAIYAVWDVSRAADLTAGVESGRVMILNQQGLVVADSVEGTVGRAVLSPELLGEFQAKTLGSAVGPDENGTQTVFGYSNLVGLTQVPEYELVEPFAFDVAAPIRALGWTVVASQDAELALAATGLLSRRILALLGSGTVVIVVGVFVFARTLVAPLGHLTEAARSIGAGQLDTPIPQLGEDEVGQLAEVLRGMVARLVQRVDQLRAASQVTHAVQATLEVERMLQNATDAIHDWFGFPLVRVYLLNPDEQVLTLQAEAGGGEGKGGPGGMSRVSVGWPNVIGNAVQFSRSQVGSGAGTLAGEGSELAVPLRLGEEILGVLYMAAREPDAFGAEEVSVMELLADQIGMSVQNARLFEQSEASLRQIEALNRRLTREGWVDYVGERGQLRYALRAGEEGEQSWPESLAEAAERGTPIARPQESEDGQAVLAVPIVLRGEVVGTLGVRRPAGHQWSDEEIGLVQAVAERVALIAEGIRLLDGADRTARREQVVSSVSAKLQHATDVDLLLQTALSELSGALGSDNISLRIGPPPEPGEEGGSEGGEDGKAEDQPRCAAWAGGGGMRDFLARLVRVRYGYADPTEHEQARALLTVSLGLFGLTTLFGMALVVTQTGQPGGGTLSSSLPIVGVAVGAMLLTYGLTQVGRVGLGSVVFIASLMLADGLAAFRFGVANNAALAGWTLPVVMAGLLLGTRASLLTATASMALLGGLAWLELRSAPIGARESLLNDLMFSFMVSGVVFYSIVLASWLFVGSVQQRAREALRRAAQLRATTEVSQATATTLDLPTLLSEVVDHISRSFGFYHAQIFLLDEAGEQALLRASTGEAGRQLLARGHRLPVGSHSVIGQVTARGEPLIVSDVSVDPVHRRNELLPDTRSELALPLRVGGQIIGALDVQSVEANAFDEEDVGTLQVMANQLAAAIEKARLLDELQRRAAENERLLQEAQANLRQIEALNLRLTREGWREYISKRAGQGTFGYTLQGDQIAEDTHWTPDMRDAFNRQRVVVREDGDAGGTKTLALPLRVRGEVIGVVEVEREGDRVWTDDDLELAEALAERLSLALDNARLLEQADTLARREQLVNKITHNVQRAESVDELLQTALVELGRALGASRGVVQLSPRGDARPQPEAAGRRSG